MIILLLVLSYFGFALIDYTNNANSVFWFRSNTEETKGIVDLRTVSQRYSTPNSEKYANIYIYNCIIEIHSSGALNFVNRVKITPIFNNFTSTNPSYVWTITYDYAGTKQIHAAFIFNIPEKVSGIMIDTTLNFTVYSSGLLAHGPIKKSLNISLLV